MSGNSPSDLIKKYQDRIIILQREIDAHPFKYMVGFRWNDESNYNYRLQREQEIEDLKRRIQEEKTREQLLSHNLLNAELRQQGVDIISEQPTPLDNFIRFMKEGSPLGIVADAVKPVAQGVGNFISSPFLPIILIAGGILIIIILMKF